MATDARAGGRRLRATAARERRVVLADGPASRRRGSPAPWLFIGELCINEFQHISCIYHYPEFYI